MKDQLIALLAATQSAQEIPRKHDEQQFKSFYGH
jgi:hypothetical protein